MEMKEELKRIIEKRKKEKEYRWGSFNEREIANVRLERIETLYDDLYGI